MSKERNIRETLEMDNRNYLGRNEDCRCNENQNNNSSRYLTVANEEVLPQTFERNECNRNTCCCKRALRRSLDILLNPLIRSLIDLSSFTLVGNNFNTEDGATTLKTVSNCSDGLVTYSDSNPLFNSTTICDLVLVAFSLQPDDGNNCFQGFNRDRFIRAITRCIPPINPRSLCCVEDGSCCCNSSKALFLADSIGPVNLKISSSSFEEPLIGFTVITVTNNIAWLINDDNRVIIVCLDKIEQFG